MTRVGIIGGSPGNGHPYSWSAILNGYDSEAVRRGGWPVIADYLDERNPDEFGVGDMRVTHAWFPEVEEALQLQAAIGIDRVVTDLHDMVDEVDAVIIAKDDGSEHRALASPFIDAGLPVLIDKPLCCSREDLQFFRPLLSSGQVFSASGLRYAIELDDVLASASARPIVAYAAVVGDWRRYAVHLLDAAAAVTRFTPLRAVPLSNAPPQVLFEMSDGWTLVVAAVGPVAKTFHLSLITAQGATSIDIEDNFTAFRRLLQRFADCCSGLRSPAVDAAMTMQVIAALVAGEEALATGAAVAV